jgi:hypothetical protein
MSLEHTSSEYTLYVNNKRIYDFYERNKDISFEAVNLIFLDLIEKINTDMTSAMQNTLCGEILSSVKDLKGLVTSLNNSVMLKIQDINKEFVGNVKLIIENSSSNNTKTYISELNRNTELFVSRINNEIPKNNNEINVRMKEILNTFQETILSDIKLFVINNSQNENTLKDYISGLDNKIQDLQKPIYSFINANQEQINNNLTSLRESNLVAHSTQNKVMEDLSDFLNKYSTNSAYKGRVSENKLEKVLSKMYPAAEVVCSKALKECGDFVLKRQNKPTILIENKNYDANVNVEEIAKFYRDVNAQKCSGIFISQTSGIVGRSDYQIELNDANVLVFLHNVDYSESKIKNAVDIIDNLGTKWAEINNLNSIEGVKISKEFLSKINDEYKAFLNNKDLLIFNIKENQKKLISNIEDLDLPDLSKYLFSIYSSEQKHEFKCDVCGEAFSKKASLASHKKIHKKELTNIVIN